MFGTAAFTSEKVIHADFGGAAGDVREKQERSVSKLNMRRITGLAPMSRVTTNFGEVYAHVLRAGDKVRTVSGEYRRIVRVERLKLDESFLEMYPEAQPIRMRKGSIGPNMPREDMMVAPYQKVRAGQPRTQVPMSFAADLVGRPFVHRTTENQIAYTNIVLDGPGQILCEGVAVDTATE